MTSTSPLRRVITLSTLTIVALGAIALTGLWHPNAPAEAMQMYLPQITLPTVVVAAAVDGINPCAFTVLLLFITAMLATMQAGEQSLYAIRTRMLSLGGIYIAAVFLTYLGLGVGLLKALDFFTRQHLPARIGALAAILFGLWMLKDFFLPDIGWRLQVQTNSTSVGLSSNWVDVPGSASVDNVTFTIDPANGAVFYRMIFP